MIVTSIVRYLWAFPNTLLGLLFAPSAALTSGGLRIVDGVLELHSPFISWFLQRCSLLPRGAAAMTLGHVVLGCDAHVLSKTRVHERVHVRQYERWGPVFIPAYVVAALWGIVTGRGFYYGNWFEREAWEFERGIAR